MVHVQQNNIVDTNQKHNINIHAFIIVNYISCDKLENKKRNTWLYIKILLTATRIILIIKIKIKNKKLPNVFKNFRLANNCKNIYIYKQHNHC